MDLGSNLTWIILAVVVVALLAFLLLRPRQRVRLSDSAPVRPHMAHLKDSPRGEGQGLPGELAAATSDVAGEFLEAPVHSHLPGASGPPRPGFRLRRSKALSDRDVDGEGPLALAMVHGRRDVHPDRGERQVVADAEPGADGEVLQAGQLVGPDRAGRASAPRLPRPASTRVPTRFRTMCFRKPLPRTM